MRVAVAASATVMALAWVGAWLLVYYTFPHPDPPPVAAPACEPCAECVAVSALEQGNEIAQMKQGSPRRNSPGEGNTPPAPPDTATTCPDYAAGLEVGRNALRQLMADWPREETQ